MTSDAVALAEGASGLLRRNARRGYDPLLNLPFEYVCPSRASYPWQWFWDSCFHAIVLSAFDVNLAKAEMRTLLSVQRPDGSIPHVIHWGTGRFFRVLADLPAYLQSTLSLQPVTTALMQPPVLAQAVLRVAERSQDEEFLREALPCVQRYYLWLSDHRDPDRDGLISVISPYETGMDQLPVYDEVLGMSNPSRLGLHLRDRLLDVKNLVLGCNYNLDAIFRLDAFNVEDVMVNCIYAQGLRAVASLSRMAGDLAASQRFDALGLRTEQAVLTKCYDPADGVFWSLGTRAERPLKVLSVSSLFPLILESIDKKRLEELCRLLMREDAMWLPYPIPSVARSERSFRPAERLVIWRGPSWVNINWFIAKGLRRHGLHEPAQFIERRTAEMVARCGFREFYNPLTGDGNGARDFGWSTLVVDMQ